MSKFTIASGKKFTFTWLDSKNNVILTSVDYKSESECLNAIAALRDKAPLATIEDQTEKSYTKQATPKYIVAKSGNSFTFIYVGEDGKTVFTSKKYSTKATCLKDITAFKDNVSQDSDTARAEFKGTEIFESLKEDETKAAAKRVAIGLRKIPTFKKIAAKARFKSKKDELKNIDKISSTGSVIRISKGKVPTFISGRFSEEKVTSASKAIAALNNLHHTMGFTNAEQEFKAVSEETISLGQKTKFYRLQQEHRGIPVFGSQMVVSTDESGNVETLSGHYTDISDTPNTKITEAQAKEVVAKDCPNSEILLDGLNYFVNSKNKAVLCWKFSTEDNMYFVDALKGSIVDKIPTTRDYSRIMNSHGVNMYGERVEFPTTQLSLLGRLWNITSLVDPLRNIQVSMAAKANDREGTVILNAGSEWNGNREAITAYVNLVKIYDYYYNVLGRKGADNNGKKINVVVQYYQVQGYTYSNAFFTSAPTDRTQICLGNGNDYAKPIDVLGHEFTHAVNNAIWGAIYKNESGALDEALADIMGECIQDGTFDTHGEDLLRKENRSFEKPEDHNQPSVYSKLLTGSSDNGYVHYNSGIINHAAYLMQKHWPTVCFSNEIATIFYKAMFYLTPNATFLDFRSAVLSAARTMRIGAAKELAIAQAFDEVEVTYPNSNQTSGVTLIYGNILDNSGKPIVDAQVSVGTVNDYTDRSGAFFIRVGKISSYSMTVSAYGYNRYTRSATVSSSVRNINVGNIRLTASSSLTPFYSLSGIITNAETGKPERDVTIRITTRANGIKEALADRYEIQLKTDEKGCYYTSAVPQGKNYVLAYKSLASDRYFLYAGGYANVTGNASRDLPLNRNTRFFVTDICITSKTSRAAAISAIPSSYLVVDKDLNKGAGGKYIYLGFNLLNGSVTPITNLVLVKSTSRLTWSTQYMTINGIRAQYTRINVDLNEGAKGQFVYLCYTRSTAYKSLSGIDVAFDSETLKDPWQIVTWNSSTEDADANLGTKGKPIYILQRRAELG